MKRNAPLVVITALLALLLGAATVGARGNAPESSIAAVANTSFSYQGSLVQNGQPVNDPTDFQFILYDAPVGGSQVGGQIVKLDRVPVTNGLFNVTLDFGAVFDGASRYLEVGVKPADVAGSYSALLPRQALLAAPYALYAQRAQTVDQIPLAGSGRATTAAHSDHEHFGQSWRGAGSAGLTVQNDPGSGLHYGVSATVGRGGVGLRGETQGGAGSYGVVGASLSGEGYGVLGVLGASSAVPTSSKVAVEGRSVLTTGTVLGVVGSVASPDDSIGVVGHASATKGETRGVEGGVNSPSGIGVHGYNSEGGNGIVGETNTSGSLGSLGFGVIGQNGVLSGIGLPPDLKRGAGVMGEAKDVPGVRGISSSSYGVYGYSGSDFAGYFQGNLKVTGNIVKAGGSFKIDHPLDPANKYLSHSFVESPDMKNIYDGMVTLDEKGEAVVTLPDWFEALNQDFRYQLTAIDAPGPNLYVAHKIMDNRFTIAGGAPGMEVSWMVTGIRHDAWANAHRIPVEEDKPAEERGTYLHPAEQGQPESKDSDAVPNQ